MFVFQRKLVIFVEYLSPVTYENFDFISQDYKINPLVTLVSFLIPLLSLIVLSNEKLKHRHISQFFIFSNFNVLTNILSLNSNLLGRLGFYFNPFNMILIPNTIFSVKDNKLRSLLVIIFFVFPFIQMLIVFPGVRGNIGNYIFFWQ